MKLRLIVGLILFVLLEGGLLTFAVREIRELAERRNKSVFKWRLNTIAGILGINILVGLFSTGIFMLLEVGIFWIFIPMIISSFIVYLIIRGRLKNA